MERQGKPNGQIEVSVGFVFCACKLQRNKNLRVNCQKMKCELYFRKVAKHFLTREVFILII